jgi:chorismate mutase
MKNKSLNTIRTQLDNLDELLLNIIKKRTNLVDKVLKVKKFKKDIVDKKRIKLILKRIKKKSLQKRIDTRLTERIWINMIRSYIDYEFRMFKKK